MINQRYLYFAQNASGDEIWMCGHCRQPADHSTGPQNKNDVAFMLMCPEGKVTLGEWTDLETKNSELIAYKQRLIADSEGLTQA